MQLPVKDKLSGSTDGKQIKLAATVSPGDTLHTAVAGTGVDNYDEIWLWGVNSDATARKTTLQWGGTTSPDNDIEKTLAAEDGLVLLVPGWVLQNSLLVKGFAALANVILIGGFINKVRP